MKGGVKMEILVMRDLIKDEYGNYYIVSRVTGNELTLVNAVHFYSFNRILNHDFVEEINKDYDKHVAVGQYFVDMVKYCIKSLKRKEVPGDIHELEIVKKFYKVHFDSLYERDVNLVTKR